MAAGDEVFVEGRKGTVTWDGRPEHAFATVRWADTGEKSKLIPASKINEELVRVGEADSLVKVKSGAFQIADRVRCRNNGEDWYDGTVKQVTPDLKVQPNGMDRAHKWDHVIHLQLVAHTREGKPKNQSAKMKPDKPARTREEETITERFLDSLPDKHIQIKAIEPVRQKDNHKDFLARVAASGGCVQLTFHGTSVENVASIAATGLRADRCGVGLFGQGAYVANHAGKAHCYTTPDLDGERHMFVVLAHVGSELREGRQDMSQGPTAADKLRNPEQYCVFEDDRLLVSHLVTYTADAKDSEAAKEAYSHALMDAVLRAGERERRHKIR